MFQNAQFFLLDGNNDISDGCVMDQYEPCQIIPTTTDEENVRACKDLERRLIEELGDDESRWYIGMRYGSSFGGPIGPYGISHLSTEERTFCVGAGGVSICRGIGVTFINDNDEQIHPNLILSKLHSLMLYNQNNGRLKLQMSMDVVMFAAPSTHVIPDGEKRKLATFHFKSELLPRRLETGEYDHATYFTPGRCPESRFIPGEKEYISHRVVNFKLWVEGVEFDLDHVKGSKPFEGYKRLLESGGHSDVKIIVKDGSPVACHQFVLIAQSPVLETMLEDDNYVESQTREIPMEDRSKEEVMSFLTYLYSGDLSKILDNTGLCVTMYEMAHYYDISGLEKALKPVLLSRSAESFGVDGALVLLKVACSSGDADLKRKAADVSQMKTNNEIFKSTIFKQLPDFAVKELFVMSRRNPE